MNKETYLVPTAISITVKTAQIICQSNVGDMNYRPGTWSIDYNDEEDQI